VRIQNASRVLLLALSVACAGCGGGSGPGPTPSPTSSTSSAILAAAADPTIPDTCLTSSIEVTRFRASDGVTIVGAVLGSGPRGVLLAHMGGTTQNLCAWFPFAQTLVSEGYLVLDVDLRGFGASGYAPETRYDLDVEAGVAELRRRGAESVELMGGSLGAIAVLVGGSQVRPPVDGIVSLSSPADPDVLDVPATIAHLRVPVLFVASEGDGQFPNDARTLYRSAPSKDKALKIVPGFDHGLDLFRFDQAAKVRALVLTFLDRHSPGSG
jgi:alpha-beta hydrolase superfamily lysophospholipase